MQFYWKILLKTLKSEHIYQYHGLESSKCQLIPNRNTDYISYPMINVMFWGGWLNKFNTVILKFMKNINFESNSDNLKKKKMVNMFKQVGKIWWMLAFKTSETPNYPVSLRQANN